MKNQKIPSLIFLYMLSCFFMVSCNNASSSHDKKRVRDSLKIKKKSNENLQEALAFAKDHQGALNDTMQLNMLQAVKDFYERNGNTIIWGNKKKKWGLLADTLYYFIQQCELYGLFPKDYQYKNLSLLKYKLGLDSLKKVDEVDWVNTDILLTDAYMHLIKDLKTGRLPTDSMFLKNSRGTVDKDYLFTTLQNLLHHHTFAGLVEGVEPRHFGYQELKKCLPKFLDSMDRKSYTYVVYPFKPNDEKDSLFFLKTISKRLRESDCFADDTSLPDSVQLFSAIKKYQKKKSLKQDGKVSAALVRILNLTDEERFKRIAITLDRYKQFPSQMPEKYIWVNLPAYYLNVWEHDTIVFESKVICGKPSTRTPLLYSVISDMVTYPTWTVPNSIITKQYLPKLKSNPYYLSRIGLRLVNAKGETVDGGSVNWGKYNKGIPYNVVQASGDGNALGIMKFNFSNPYMVYLHDTNQRYLFKNASRALSHGCVRVQQWEQLAFYISRNDSINLKQGDTLAYNTDSIKNWLAAKVKKRIPVKNGIPLFITYFCCEGKSGKIRFYDDIYGEDKWMRERVFNDK